MTVTSNAAGGRAAMSAKAGNARDRASAVGAAPSDGAWQARMQHKPVPFGVAGAPAGAFAGLHSASA